MEERLWQLERGGAFESWLGDISEERDSVEEERREL